MYLYKCTLLDKFHIYRCIVFTFWLSKCISNVYWSFLTVTLNHNIYIYSYIYIFDTLYISLQTVPKNKSTPFHALFSTECTNPYDPLNFPQPLKVALFSPS